MPADELDEALERFQLSGCEYGGGLSNHGPMAAEALVALGHRALVPGLVERYAPRLPPAEAPGRALSEAERIDALGRFERLGDWIASFEAELEESSWQTVLARGVSRLADGPMAAAGHGWLRVAHAARALGAAETPERRRELAIGLGYWAARHQRLPGEPGARPRKGRDPERALLAVAPAPPRKRKGFLLTDVVRALDGDAGYREAVESIDLDAFDAEPDAWLGSLCRGSARSYLAHPAARIARVHSLTVPSALRLVRAHLDPGSARRAAGAVFQVAAALHAVSAPPPGAGEPEPDAEVLALAESPDEIRYRAACSLEEHAIKMAEACLRENDAAPDLVLRRAAADAALHLESGAGRVC